MKLILTTTLLMVMWQCNPTPAPAARVATQLQWDQSTTPRVTYRVYRSQSHGGPYQLVTQIPGTMYVDNTVRRHNVYYYVVRAWDGTLESVNSNELMLSVP